MKPKDLLDINPVLVDRVRLAIMTTLSVSGDFNTLLDKLDLTKGNLSSHVRKLEEAKLVKVTKEFVDRKPKTTYSCTKKGKKALKEYLSLLEGIVTKLN